MGWAALSLIVLTAIILPFVALEGRLEAWGHELFAAAADRPVAVGAVVMGLLAGDVLLPVPSSIVSTFAGAALGWRLAAATIWAGMTMGALAGYALGAGALRPLALRLVGERELARASRLAGDAGALGLVLTRAVPVLAEASTLAAGAARMNLWLFFAATAASNLVVALAYAGVGAAAANNGSFLLAFIGLAAIPAAAWWLWRATRVRR
jgi:uncharacterized membrane protein YdjX (TVP38/TMEM64 family)